eukprot:5426068-Amphidinium_carterae.1
MKKLPVNRDPHPLHTFRSEKELLGESRIISSMCDHTTLQTLMLDSVKYSQSEAAFYAVTGRITFVATECRLQRGIQDNVA